MIRILFFLLLLSTEVYAQRIQQDSMVTCNDEVSSASANVNYTILRSCTWRGYQSIEIDRGNFIEYRLFRLEGDEKRAIVNSDLFSRRKSELEIVFNRRLKGEFKSYIAEEEINKTFNAYELPDYTLNDMQMMFLEGEKLAIRVPSGLGAAYANLSEVYVEYRLEELLDYIN